MSDVIITASPDPMGNPNGIFDGPKNSKFYKTGSFYKINYYEGDGWQDVYFKEFGYSDIYLNSDDTAIMNSYTGSYLYVKTTGKGTKTGWVLSAEKRITV